MDRLPKIELHCHTKMSTKRGLIAPGELVRYAYDKGYKAIAITDQGNVQAFPEVYLTWKELWEKYKKECEKNGEEALQKDFLKVIYGMEGVLPYTNRGMPENILIYAKNEKGLRNLYKIVTESNLNYDDGDRGVIRREVLDRYREGLLVGAHWCGELWLLDNADDQTKEKVISYYDFLEIVPFEFKNMKKIVDYGKKYHKPVVATSDADCLEEEDVVSWSILSSYSIKEWWRSPERSLYMMDQERMREAFIPLLNLYTDAERIEVEKEIFGNQSLIADQIDYVSPLCEERLLPVYPEAEKKLTYICNQKIKEIYGIEVPEEVRERLDMELQAVCKNGHAGIFMMWKELVDKSHEKGYPVIGGGATASSLLSFLCGITDINPVSKKFGGLDIPIESFLGKNLEKEPCFEVSFAGLFHEVINGYLAELPGVGDTCRPGTINTIQEDEAKNHIEQFFVSRKLPLPAADTIKYRAGKICGIKKEDDYLSNVAIVVPEGKSITDYTPLCEGDFFNFATHLDYHYIDSIFLRMNISYHSSLKKLHDLQEMTKVSYEKIPLEDKRVMDFVCDVNADEIPDLPEFGTRSVRSVIRETCPKTFADLIKVYSLYNCMDIWEGNQKNLVCSGKIVLRDCITSGDDIMLFLMDKGMDKSDAYRIMESVREGKGLKNSAVKMLEDLDIPDWYIEVCNKIKYLLPKAHSALYTLAALRMAYYMVYYPDEYKKVICHISKRIWDW